MFLFFTKRLLFTLIALPLVVFISLLLFQVSPIDPVERLIDQGEFSMNNEQYKKIYESTAKKNKLHIPFFYFSIKPSNYTAEYFDLILPSEKELYKKRMSSGASFEATNTFILKLQKLRQQYKNQIEQNPNNIASIRSLESATSYNNLIKELNILKAKHTDFYTTIDTESKQYQESKSIWNLIIPKLIWHGNENIFQRQMSRVLSFDFGISVRDGLPVPKKVFQSFYLTALMLVLSFIMVFPLGIWLGKSLTNFKKKQAPKVIEMVLFTFASIPLFWLATLLLIFLTSPEYARSLYIFPSVSNYSFSPQVSFWGNILNHGNQLILPVLAISLGELAIITRHTRSLLDEQVSQPYMLTALMKGLSHKQATNTHAFQNSKIQILTMISSGITSSLAGSIVVEYIFNIPGMGRLLLDSIKFADWPVLLFIILFIYFITSIIYLISDVLYSKIDPRINLIYES